MIKKNSYFVIIIIAILTLISLDSCDPTKKLKEDEAASISAFLIRNDSLNFELKPSGLYYVDLVEGSGRQAITHDTAYVKYTGLFLDGEIFDSNVESTDTLIIPVNEGWLIPGFDEGMTYMKEGGKAFFLIPSNLGYGASGWYAIPGYCPLLFEVEMLIVKPGPGK